MKAEWRNKDLSKSPWLERAKDYELFHELVLPDGGVIARIECFAMNPTYFYATTPAERSGALGSIDLARQWCETKTGNKVN
jgi:hypothetical protein